MSQTAETYGDGTLDFHMVPSLKAPIKRDGYRPIVDYLGETLDVPTEMTVGDTYGSVVDALGDGTGDVAEMGPLSAALGVSEQNLEIALQRKGYGGWTYASVVVTDTDGPVDSMDDLVDKRIAFADCLSTSGTLMPLYMLDQAGLEIGSYPMETDRGEADFEATFTSQSDAWNELKSGTADAAGLGRFLTYDRETDSAVDGYTYLDEYEELPDPPVATSAQLSDTEKSAVVGALVDAPARVFHGADGEPDTDDDLWFSAFREASAVRYQVVIDAAETVGIKSALLETE